MVNKTNISTLGEFGLIKHLTQDIKPKNNTTRYGIGDDAAVLDFKGYQTLVTSDILLEGIHFNLEYVPLKHLGYKAAVVNFSDIYAMNGRPTQLIVSLGISKRFAVEDLEQLYAGLKAACDIYGVDIVGGDTTSSMTGLTISITCIGEAKKEDIVYRNGAKINDLICCTGNLGAAYMGLQLLERERAVGETDPEKAQKAFEGREYILERQLKPEARKDVIAALKKADIHPTSMMDISDGLSSELLHICSQSKVGCSVYADKLPIDYQSAAMGDEPGHRHLRSQRRRRLRTAVHHRPERLREDHPRGGREHHRIHPKTRTGLQSGGPQRRRDCPQSTRLQRL